MLKSAQPVVRLDVPPGVAHIIFDPVINSSGTFSLRAAFTLKSLHVEKVVLFMMRVVAKTEFHPSLKTGTL